MSTDVPDVEIKQISCSLDFIDGKTIIGSVLYLTLFDEKLIK